MRHALGSCACLLLLSCASSRQAPVHPALADFPGRYEEFEKEAIPEVKELERTYGRLLTLLTTDNAFGGPHGSAHKPDDRLEHEFWALLKKLATYHGSGRMILAAIDEVYLGYRDSGNWGWWWQWPYFNCFKATLLGDRLEKDFPDLAEEGLWTKIYCSRVNGLATSKYGEEPRLIDFEAMEAQYFWKADPERVKALCQELLKRFPVGKYSARARDLMSLDGVTLTLTGTPGEGAAAVIDRRPR